jgi:hypothetical protein
MADRAIGNVIATSSSVKKGIVGIGSIVQDTLFNRASETIIRNTITFSTKEE